MVFSIRDHSSHGHSKAVIIMDSDSHSEVLDCDGRSLGSHSGVLSSNSIQGGGSNIQH